MLFCLDLICSFIFYGESFEFGYIEIKVFFNLKLLFFNILVIGKNIGI